MTEPIPLDDRPIALVDAQIAFREELFASGLLVGTATDGIYLRSGLFEEICHAISELVSRSAAGEALQSFHGPLVIDSALLERTDYARSFPNLIGSITSFTGGEAEHAKLIEAMESGDDWGNSLRQTGLGLCSAACHPIYPTQVGRLPLDGRVIEIVGRCFRHEPSVDPARMQEFRQHEFVHLGDEASARAHRDKWMRRALEIHGSLGLSVKAVEANDPFFGRTGRMLAANQRHDDLKIELVTAICSQASPTAITSLNRHLDHFGRAFHIESADGSPAHTACIGFGIERITLALLATHGLSPKTWPSSVRSVLGLA